MKVILLKKDKTYELRDMELNGPFFNIEEVKGIRDIIQKEGVEPVSMVVGSKITFERILKDESRDVMVMLER